eukprot:TRINITY_DN11326_c0_g1_i7.p1 TRINITY_DN11326_c0_g1~~TRINITY_DN11326_c0_g1_i7.p1  ORF type:complete len:408 (-),score=85.09 TRINITY_DN11326_c0_g1_i7:575-1798(-)
MEDPDFRPSVKRKVVEDTAQENSSKKAGSGECDEDLTTVSSAHFVVNQYELLKRILTYLTPRQLGRTARVARAWNEAAKVIRREREKGGKPSAFWWTQPKDLKLTLKDGQANRLVLKEILQDFKDKLNAYTSNLPYSPKLIIWFNSVDPDDEEGDDNEFSRLKVLEAGFPKATILGCGCTGLVGTDSSGKGVESEHRTQRFERCSILFIPPWHNLQIETLVDSAEAPYRPELKLPRADAALLLTPDNYLQDIGIVNDNIALCGATPDFVYGPIRALLFNNIRSAVVLLPHNLKTEKKVEKEISKLKGKFNEKNGFGIMLSCTGRGKNFYKGKKNVESRIFHSIFPDVPLVGFFGYGEIGFSSKNTYENPDDFDIQTYDEGSSEDQFVDNDDVFHGFSTVIMVISQQV